jgi:hypothetical protein
MRPETTIPSAELEERLRFETMLADFSSKFVNLPAGEVDREIMDAQRRICEFHELNLLVLWQLSDDAGGFFSATHPHSAQQGPKPPLRLHEDDYPWFKQQLRAGRTVAFASLEEVLPRHQRQRVPWRVPNVGAVDESRASGSPRASG